MSTLSSEELMTKLFHHFTPFEIPDDKSIRIGSLCEMYKELEYERRCDLDLSSIANAICRYTEKRYEKVTNDRIKLFNINDCCRVFADIDDHNI